MAALLEEPLQWPVSCILQQDEDIPGMCPKARQLPVSKPSEAGSERSVACAHCHHKQLSANLKLHKAAASQAAQGQNTLQLFELY